MLGMVERTVRIDELPLRLIVAAAEDLMIEPVARFNKAALAGAGRAGPRAGAGGAGAGFRRTGTAAEAARGARARARR